MVAIIEDVSSSASRIRGRPAAGLDAISKAIIEQLQADGRRPYARIADAVGLVRGRRPAAGGRLIETGVVQIVAVTNPLQLGFTRQAMIGIKAEGNLEPVVEALHEHGRGRLRGGHRRIVRHLGRGGLRGRRPPAQPAQPQIRTIPGVRTTESFVYLKLSKQTYQWGTR